MRFLAIFAIMMRIGSRKMSWRRERKLSRQRRRRESKRVGFGDYVGGK